MAPGPYSENSEFFSLLDDEIQIPDWHLINKEWLVSEFILLPKKQGAKACGYKRTISLISHMFKLSLKSSKNL